MDLSKVKRFAVELALEGECAVVVVDTSTPGVEVPKHLGKMVELYLGHDMDPPIPDLWHDDEGVTATLTFNGEPSFCKFPWAAVCFVHDGDRKNAVVFPSGGTGAPLGGPTTPRGVRLSIVMDPPADKEAA